MKPGDQVVLLADPWGNGLGTVVGMNEIGWVEIHWANEDVGAYPAQHLELADAWEHRQVEQDTRDGIAR